MHRIYDEKGLKSLSLHSSAVLVPFTLVLRPEDARHLATTCFRGPSVRRAGNFMTWVNIQDMLKDPIVHLELVEEVLEVIQELITERKTALHAHTFTVIHDRQIGWAWNVDSEDLPQNTRLSRFRLSDELSAFQIMDARVPAPQTPYVTFSLNFAKNVNGWEVRIVTIYPGDMVECGSKRPMTISPAKIVFFPPNHIGATP